MNKLDELKEILFGDEQRTLDDLSDRLETPDRRMADLVEILPDSIEESHRGGRLASAIRKPLSEVMAVAIREEPKSYADALFPIMGPAIRRAIAEALKALTQQLNEAIEHSVTPQGLRWRFEAWRAGIPFSQYLLHRTLLYRVEQAYLIDVDSGLLIAHVADESIQYKDEDAVSAMFTALQEFIKDSFLGEHRRAGLESAEMGDLTIWAVHGPESILAAVVRGSPPRSLRSEMRGVLETIEGRFRETLIQFSGDREESSEIESELRRCLRSSRRADVVERRSGGISPVAILGALAVLLAIAWLVRSAITTQQTRRVADAFERTPGVVVTEIDHSGGKIVVSGFRDPLAAPTAEIVAGSGVREERVVARLTPFVSLDADILAARARRILEPPDGVRITATEAGPAVHGTATPTWVTEANRRARLVPGLEETQFHVTAVDPVKPAQLEFDSLLASVDGASVRFTENDTLESSEEPATRKLAADMGRLADLGRELGVDTRFVITGFTDETGTAAINVELQALRASALASAIERAAGRKLDIERASAGLGSLVSARQATVTVIATPAVQEP